MVKFVNVKFDFNKKVSFSYSKVVLFIIIIFSLGFVSGMTVYLLKNKSIKNVLSPTDVSPALDIILTPILTPTLAPVSGDAGELSSRDLATDYWKIYRNEKYGFEFQYPSIYEEKEKFKSCGLKERNNTVEPYLFISVASRIWIQVLDSKGLSLLGYVDGFIKKDTMEIISKKSGFIDGKESIEITYRLLESKSWGEMTFILKDKKIFVFSLERPNSECASEKDDVSIFAVFSHILSTFRFIN